MDRGLRDSECELIHSEDLARPSSQERLRRPLQLASQSPLLLGGVLSGHPTFTRITSEVSGGWQGFSARIMDLDM